MLIFEEAFANTNFKGNFENISNLQLRAKAFAKSNDPIILIKNCYLDVLIPLETRMKEIQFIDSKIVEIQTGAFNVIQILSIIFRNCEIGRIEEKSFTTKVCTSVK